MNAVEEVKIAIERLTFEQRAELTRWMHGWKDDDWDKRISADARSGKLDHLIEKAKADVSAGHLRDIP